MPADAAEFATLYRLHAPVVQRRARALLGSNAEASEVVQDLFVSLWQRPSQFSGKSSLTTFLYSATTHTCLNRLRDRRNQARLLSEFHGANSVISELPRSEHLVQLRNLLQRLPDDLAQVAVYYYLDEMTYDEVASTMGCSRRHVANLLQRLLDWHREEGGNSWLDP